MARDSEKHEGQPIAGPAILDVVKIDGRWAQVRYGGGVVNFLDDNSTIPINWEDYQLSRTFGNLSVKSMIQIHSIVLSEREIQNIHWGSEQDQNPMLKLEVTAFGEYVKK